MTYWICNLYDEKYRMLCTGDFVSLEGAKRSINRANKDICFAVIVGSDNGEIHKYMKNGVTFTEVFK